MKRIPYWNRFLRNFLLSNTPSRDFHYRLISYSIWSAISYVILKFLSNIAKFSYTLHSLTFYKFEHRKKKTREKYHCWLGLEPTSRCFRGWHGVSTIYRRRQHECENNFSFSIFCTIRFIKLDQFVIADIKILQKNQLLALSWEIFWWYSCFHKFSRNQKLPSDCVKKPGRASTLIIWKWFMVSKSPDFPKCFRTIAYWWTYIPQSPP